MGKIKNILIFITIFLSCKNNPFFPMADVRVTIPNPVITLEYTIEENKITLNYPILTILFEEIYGGTYANIESLYVEYFNPSLSNNYADSIIKTLSPYKAGFPLYIPPSSQVEAQFNVVTDEVENIFSPPGGFEGPLGVLISFYGRDGNGYKLKIKTKITVQRVVVGG